MVPSNAQSHDFPAGRVPLGLESAAMPNLQSADLGLEARGVLGSVRFLRRSGCTQGVELALCRVASRDLPRLWRGIPHRTDSRARHHPAALPLSPLPSSIPL